MFSTPGRSACGGQRMLRRSVAIDPCRSSRVAFPHPAALAPNRQASGAPRLQGWPASVALVSLLVEHFAAWGDLAAGVRHSHDQWPPDIGSKATQNYIKASGSQAGDGEHGFFSSLSQEMTLEPWKLQLGGMAATSRTNKSNYGHQKADGPCTRLMTQEPPPISSLS